MGKYDNFAEQQPIDIPHITIEKDVQDSEPFEIRFYKLTNADEEALKRNHDLNVWKNKTQLQNAAPGEATDLAMEIVGNLTSQQRRALFKQSLKKDDADISNDAVQYVMDILEEDEYQRALMYLLAGIDVESEEVEEAIKEAKEDADIKNLDTA